MGAASYPLLIPGPTLIFSMGKKLFTRDELLIRDFKKSSLFFILHTFPTFISGLNRHGTSFLFCQNWLFPVLVSNTEDIFSTFVFCVTFFRKKGVILLCEKSPLLIVSPDKEDTKSLPLLPLLPFPSISILANISEYEGFATIPVSYGDFAFS